VDAGTYASDIRRLEGCEVKCINMDIRDTRLGEIFSEHVPDTVVHFAAETHVTRSEGAENLFFEVNVEGTRNLLNTAKEARTELVLHVSTDEVYGSAIESPFKEEEKLIGEGRATSAYARSKAVADDLAMQAAAEIPVIVARPTNCFGPWQHLEKAIPRWTAHALRGNLLPVWGDGQQIRDWLYVSDAVTALKLLLERGVAGNAYNIGPEGPAVPNVEIAQRIAALCGLPSDKVQLTSYDRPSHDRRYSINADRLRSLGWKPMVDLDDGLRRTVEWYRTNANWWRPLVAEAEGLYSDIPESQQ
jgi:dTDP-glucose 4,6-dehydratase